jgi:hypothetical protein
MKANRFCFGTGNQTPMPPVTNLSVVGDIYKFMLPTIPCPNGFKVYVGNCGTFDVSKISLMLHHRGQPGTIIQGKVSEMIPVPTGSKEAKIKPGKNYLYVVTIGNGVMGKKTCNSEPVQSECEIDATIAYALENKRLNSVIEYLIENNKVRDLTIKALANKQGCSKFGSILSEGLERVKKLFKRSLKTDKKEEPTSTEEQPSPAPENKPPVAVETEQPPVEEKPTVVDQPQTEQNQNGQQTQTEQQTESENNMRYTTKWKIAAAIAAILIIGAGVWGFKSLFSHQAPPPPMRTAHNLIPLPLPATNTPAVKSSTNTNAVATTPTNSAVAVKTPSAPVVNVSDVTNSGTVTLIHGTGNIGGITISGGRGSININMPTNPPQITPKVIVVYVTNTVTELPPPAPPQPAQCGYKQDETPQGQNNGQDDGAVGMSSPDHGQQMSQQEALNYLYGDGYAFNDAFYHRDIFGNDQGY